MISRYNTEQTFARCFYYVYEMRDRQRAVIRILNNPQISMGYRRDFTYPLCDMFIRSIGMIYGT